MEKEMIVRTKYDGYIVGTIVRTITSQFGTYVNMKNARRIQSDGLSVISRDVEFVLIVESHEATEEKLKQIQAML